MMNDCRRIARSLLAPRVIAFGLSAFLFGSALVSYLRASDSSYESRDALEDLLFSSLLLAAAAALCTRGARAGILAAVLSSPLPLLHFLFFLASAPRARALPFSAAHLRAWLHELATMPAFALLVSSAYLAVFLLALPSALKRHPPRAPSEGA